MFAVKLFELTRNRYKRLFDSKVKEFSCRISFNNIEEYAQYMADVWRFSSPDAIIHYADGSKKEIFSDK